MRSLRWQLLISASLAGAIVLGLLGLSVYIAMRHALVREFDASLRSDARLLASMIQQKNDGRLDFEFDSKQMPEFLSDRRARYFQIWQVKDGKVIARSPSLRDKSLDRPSRAPEFTADMELPGDRDGRAIVIAYSPELDDDDERRQQPKPNPVTILVAAEPLEVHHTLNLLAWLLSTLGVIAIATMGMVLSRVVNRGIRPLQRLSTDIERLRETELSHRFNRDLVPTELAPMVEKLNGLLGRLEDAFAREKGFTSDVAHELRTPLTGLRTTLEVCRSQPRERVAYEAAIDQCSAITDRMTVMVESLLMLARLDAGQIPVASEEVDISMLVTECWHVAAPRVDHLAVEVSLDLLSECNLRTDEDKLRIIVNNLIDNAVSYVNKSGRIAITSRRDSHRAIIEVANTGSQIAREDIPKLFLRFWRGDISRTDSSNHCGLGLALAQRLITLLGGTIAVDSTLGGEFRVQLVIPNTTQSPQ